MRMPVQARDQTGPHPFFAMATCLSTMCRYRGRTVDLDHELQVRSRALVRFAKRASRGPLSPGDRHGLPSRLRRRKVRPHRRGFLWRDRSDKCVGESPYSFQEGERVRSPGSLLSSEWTHVDQRHLELRALRRARFVARSSGYHRDDYLAWSRGG
mgnify:CR=1 FL=1